MDVELKHSYAASLSLRNLTLIAGSQDKYKTRLSFWQVFARTHPQNEWKTGIDLLIDLKRQ